MEFGLVEDSLQLKMKGSSFPRYSQPPVKVCRLKLGLLAGLLLVILGLCESRVGASTACRILLVPGAFGARGSEGGAKLFLRSEEYFAEYRDFFAQRGCRIRLVEFPADATIEERGQILRNQVQSWKAEGPLFLLGHSQGALDARFALKELKLSGVAGLISIGAPHRGTPAAEWVVSQRDLRSLCYWVLRGVARFDLDELRFVGELTPSFLAGHPDQFAAVPGVRYSSAQGDCRSDCHWVLRITAAWLGIGPGDGIVPRESQRFGDDLGAYDLDHISEVGVDTDKRIERLRFLNRVWVWMDLQ